MKTFFCIFILVIAANFSIMAQTAICQNISVQLDDTGQIQLFPSDVDNGSIGDEPFQYLVTPDILTCVDKGMVSVTLTVTDKNGFTDECISSVKVYDNISPSVYCNEVFDWSLDEVLTADVFSIMSDNCEISETMVFPNSFDLPGTFNVSLIVFDDGGNASSCSSLVHVIGDGADNEAPIITECPNVLEGVEVDALCSYIVEDYTNLVFATDNVTEEENLVITQSPTPGTELSGSGLQSITFTVTDEANNSSSCIMQLEVNDNIPPTIINCPLDQTGVIITSYTFPDFTNEFGAYDNCTDNFNLITSQNPIAGSTTSLPGIHEVTIEVVDIKGNIGTCSFALDLFDESDLYAYCQDVDVMLDHSGNAEVTAEMIDNGSYGSGPLDYILDYTTFSCADVGANTVTMTVIDQSGNTNSCIGVVTVMDAVMPNVTCIDYALVLDSDGNGMIATEDIIDGVYDNCGIESMMLSQTEFNSSDVGDNVIGLNVMDFSGNMSTCNSIVTVSESNAVPNAICQDVTVLLDTEGFGMISPAQIDNGSHDDVGIISMILDVDVFDCNDVGSNVAILTVSDEDGNESNCSSIVNVFDFQFPIIETMNISLALDGDGQVNLNLDDVVVSASDNCSMPAISVDQTAFSCVDIGVNTIEILATDASGNTTVSAVDVTILDDVNPEVICQDFTLTLDESGNGTLETGDIDGGSFDNCSIIMMAASQIDFIIDDIGVNEVELTVTDLGGNSSSCTSQVTVIENIETTFTGPGDLNFEGDEDCSLVCPDFNEQCMAMNFCGDSSEWIYTQSPPPGELLIGTNEIFMTVTDDCDITQSCSFTVSISGLVVSIIEDSGTLTTDVEADNYQWYYCNGDIVEDANQQSFTPTESGSYSLSAIVNSCSGSSDCEEVVITGLVENELEVGLTLYPNPNKGVFSINLESEVNDGYLISIYNEVGKLVHQENNTSGNTINFNLNNAAPGIYMLLLQGGENRAKRHFVVE